MSHWLNDKVMKWQDDIMESWKKWQADKMTSWKIGKLTKSQDGGKIDKMTRWQNGNWQNGYWQNGKLTKWQVVTK